MMKTLDEVTERVKERVRGCQWVHEDLRVWARRFGPAPEEDKEDTREAYVRGLCRRKAQWPERADADAAVVFLSSKACLPYLALCRDQTLEGSDWEPVWAWFEQTDQTTQNPRAGWIHQILRRKDAEAGVDGPYVLEDGCKRKVTATFYWDVADVPACPESASGVQYEVNVRGRDDETGLYNCVVTRTETVRQDVSAYETHEETGETRYRADALGLREEEAKSDENPNAGGTVDQKIEDYAKAQGLELEDGPKELKDGTTVGVVVDLQKQKNADCTTDVTIQNIHEEESTEHVVEKRVTVRGEQTATTHLNITAEKAGEYKAGYEAEDKDGTLKAGTLTMTHVEKTPGGVRNVTVTKTTSTPVEADSGNTVCAKTIYEHVHTTLAENQETATREPKNVEDWAGEYEQVQVIANDDGTFNEEVKKTTELEVADAQTETTTDYFGTTTRTLGQNLKQETVEKGETWNPGNTVVQAKSPDNGTGVSGGGDSRANVTVQKQEIVTPGGVRNIQITTQKASPATAKATFGADSNGRKTTVGWFRNLTKDEAEAFMTGFSGGSIQRNAFGLYDGTCSYTTAGDGGGSGGGKYTTFDETRTVQSGRMASNGGSLFKITEIITYITGICHDSDPTPESQTSPYAKVAGCIDARVSNLGEGYWSYYGITEKTERWEYVGEMPTATTTGIREATWKASDVTNPGGGEDKDA